MTSLLENSFFSMPTRSMPSRSMPTQFTSQYGSQYAYTVCLSVSTHSILRTVSLTVYPTVCLTASQISKYNTKFFIE